ncbi:MAG: discoidin domain-containing protein [Actinomycetota bacterium]
MADTGPVPVASPDIAAIPCPSCGSPNPEYNRHCEQCGARLSQDPLPVAPAPNLRTSPGGRALGVLGAVVLLIALAALIFNVFRGGEETASSTSSTTSSTTVPAAAVEIFPVSAEASSFLNGHEPESLIDGDDSTDWNDASAKGLDAWITFTFSPPVRITEIRLQNLLDDERFKRNYKIQGYIITTDDLAMEVSGRMQNTNDPQHIPIASLGTRELTIQVKSTYPGEAVDDNVPYNELALQAVRFFGSDAP